MTIPVQLPMQLPAEAPLDMPVQRLDGNPPAAIEVKTRPHGMAVKRLLMILLTAMFSLAASSEVRLSFSRDGLDLFDAMLLLCFVPLFTWVAFGFVVSTIGFFKLISGEHPGFTAIPSPASALRHRTAVLMPVYNESVEDTFGRVRAMARSIAQAGGAGWIDFFILSDSNPFHGKAELAAWEKLAPQAPIHVYYRRREQNIARKPGNIAEWVRRFGGAYENMLVLDADSMMSGAAIVGMAAIMEERPSIGLLQTVPMITNARTLFQRWMQFASEAYGPIASAGLLWWSGAEANFWGHNAIVRTRAFAESCGLPELPGKAPFGGHIQSHDMFESALLRRRGWAVHMIMIGGSYEEFPPSIVDFSIRDRRWMQGNLQHLRLLGASGLNGASRLHLFLGATAYLTSPGWLLLLLTSILRVGVTGDYQPAGGMPFNVLWLTLVLLFGPKIMGAIWLLADGARRRAFGGGFAVVRSVLTETLFSILLAPITMVTQTKALVGLLLGIPSGWTTQTRDAHRIEVRSVLPLLREHLALGALFAATALLNAWLAIWLLPLTVGLLCAPWLISLTSSDELGDAAGRAGLFRVPPPDIEDVASDEPQGEAATA
ncbi:Putative Glycosyl transferase, family 2 [Novosphingobium nitrogenifigens DSM 19370]|uniref:Glucans biosynthesis glucosyltransferase H n=1 Tax=Novosphingobium nitrogenifigens DSM 19370 TaxID=983920 RepID=F1ZB15_9SPHN|nr:glucans biosynthesis glucosyltransferase MdoH [Novosphingobium nitrogenifigens]EGD58118.1 Putative Glycosyl transferase, family 2 [Novosphingobium nitrogenifigens DSM 19370]